MKIWSPMMIACDSRRSPRPPRKRKRCLPLIPLHGERREKSKRLCRKLLILKMPGLRMLGLRKMVSRRTR